MPGQHTHPFLRRSLKVAVVILVLLFFAWLTVSYIVADHLTARPWPRRPEKVPEIDWGKLESHQLLTSDGEQIAAWFIAGRDDRPVVVLLHGYQAARRSMLGSARFWARRGLSVMAISQRGHGESSGDRVDFGYSARHDVVAAVDFLGRRLPGRPILIHGRSMGAASAIFAAGEIGDPVHGYILECPYLDLRTAVWNRAQLKLPPVLDWVAFRGMIAVSPLVLPHAADISPINAIEKMPANVPLLILAGAKDRHARPHEARKLNAAAPGPSELIIFESAGHTGLKATDPQRYNRSLSQFLRRTASDG